MYFEDDLHMYFESFCYKQIFRITYSYMFLTTPSKPEIILDVLCYILMWFGIILTTGYIITVIDMNIMIDKTIVYFKIIVTW